jgi:hypothetical protein
MVSKLLPHSVAELTDHMVSQMKMVMMSWILFSDVTNSCICKLFGDESKTLCVLKFLARVEKLPQLMDILRTFRLISPPLTEPVIEHLDLQKVFSANLQCVPDLRDWDFEHVVGHRAM